MNVPGLVLVSYGNHLRGTLSVIKCLFSWVNISPQKVSTSSQTCQQTLDCWGKWDQSSGDTNDKSDKIIMNKMLTIALVKIDHLHRLKILGVYNALTDILILLLLQC